MESEIIKLMKEENFDGLELFIDEYGDDIVRTISAILDRPEESMYKKEVRNDVFYKIWLAIGSYDSEKSSLKTWALTITRNTCLDTKRKLIRERNIQPVEQLPDKEEHSSIASFLEKDQFLDMLVSLNPEDQLIFLKYYFYQDTAKEIALDLKIDPSQVYNHLSRGRAKLKKFFREGENLS